MYKNFEEQKKLLFFKETSILGFKKEMKRKHRHPCFKENV